MARRFTEYIKEKPSASLRIVTVDLVARFTQNCGIEASFHLAKIF